MQTKMDAPTRVCNRHTRQQLNKQQDKILAFLPLSSPFISSSPHLDFSVALPSTVLKVVWAPWSHVLSGYLWCFLTRLRTQEKSVCLSVSLAPIKVPPTLSEFQQMLTEKGKAWGRKAIIRVQSKDALRTHHHSSCVQELVVAAKELAEGIFFPLWKMSGHMKTPSCNLVGNKQETIRLTEMAFLLYGFECASSDRWVWWSTCCSLRIHS